MDFQVPVCNDGAGWYVDTVIVTLAARIYSHYPTSISATNDASGRGERTETENIRVYFLYFLKGAFSTRVSVVVHTFKYNVSK